MQKEKMDFLENVTVLLVRNERNGIDVDACGYTETLSQELEDSTLDAFIADITQYNVNYHYEEDDTHGYTSGRVYLFLESKTNSSAAPSHYYRLVLKSDGRYTNYCECKPGMEGYDERHKCCGINCDWSAPAIILEKEECVQSFSFKGEPRDLWAVRDKWHGVTNEIKKQELEKEIASIDLKAEELRKTKKDLQEKIGRLSKED